MSSAEPATLVPWRHRGDIVARPRRGGWVLKDPVALRYFTFREEEYFVWSRLDGQAVTDALCAAFAERFAPQRLSLAELQKFIGQLIGQGLVVADQLGSTATTTNRRLLLSKWQRLAGLNLLAIRFRGVDPDQWLNRLLPWFGGLFSAVGVACGLVLIASAFVLWGSHAAEFARRWPEEVAQWTVADVWSFAAVLVAVKILHEFGHGLACKRFGGEVHELGLLLLVFTPCMYCNVSDAWLLPSKWQRMGVSAAGMWVESVLAAACVWLWWLSVPGWFHSACLQIVFVCAVSTILFNINPLLRYDGYFLLADGLEVPNLQQQSWSELQRCVMGWLTGIRTPSPQGLTTRMQFWLPVYAAVSVVYRLAMVGTILWFLYHWLEPQGLGRVAQGIGLATILGLLVGPVMQIRQGWSNPQTPRRFGCGALVRLTVLATAVATLLFVPLPRRVVAPILLEPADAQGVYVTVEGALDWIAPPGTVVQAGDEIGRLVNTALEREIGRLAGELTHAEVLVAGLERRRLHDPQAALQLPAALERQADLTEQLQQRHSEAERLSLRAPQAGTLWPAPARPKDNATGQLADWSNSVFDPQNQRCWLTAGTLIGQVGRERRLEAVGYLAQRDVTALEPGQAVRVQLNSAPGRVLAGELLGVAATQTPELSAQRALRLKLPAVPGRTGSRLVGTWYQTRVGLPEHLVPAVSHGGGTVAIVVPPQSLAERLGRWGQETFPGVW